VSVRFPNGVRLFLPPKIGVCVTDELKFSRDFFVLKLFLKKRSENEVKQRQQPTNQPVSQSHTAWSLEANSSG
jgi:hypothetical protein